MDLSQQEQERRRYPRLPSRLNEQEVAAIRKIKADDPDITPHELAERFGVSISHMRNILSGLSWRTKDLSEDPSNPEIERRRYHRMSSRLTPEEVATIRKLKAENPRLTARELAIRFKVSATHIYDIWKGNTWRDRQDAARKAQE
jgi:predicted HTH transcriptional regulator